VDNWLKALVAAACVVICAGGAYFAWSKWQAMRDAEANRAAIWQMLDAAPGDIEKATETCTRIQRNLGYADSLSWDADQRNYARQVIALCQANRFL
jgi:predicted negative regulator of RcsB-dependent stress response